MAEQTRVHADAQQLVNAAKDFTNSGSEDAKERFTAQWHQIVTAGNEYRDQVETEAKNIANGSWNPYVPSAEVDNNGISFYSPSANDLAGAHNRIICGYNDGITYGMEFSPQGYKSFEKDRSASESAWSESLKIIEMQKRVMSKSLETTDKK